MSYSVNSKSENPSLVVFGLGSNLGNKHENILKAILRIDRRIGEVDRISHFYVTAPLNPPENPEWRQPHYLNSTITCYSRLSSSELINEVLEIENELGRTRDPGKRWFPRFIDIDILFIDNLVIMEHGLIVPHPELHKREFVLRPLSEIAPNIVHPILGKTIADLCREL
jgi:2-amino-4-hydroxy-6-hydroxymethyldihydropteridine diphosphokinase